MDSSAENVRIGERIRHLRLTWKLTQRQLAEILHLGNAQTISTIENGSRALRAYELAILAKHFKIRIEDLIDRLESPTIEVRWRSMPEVATAKPIEALFLSRCRNYAFVERITDSVPGETVCVKQGYVPKNTSYEEVSDWALHVRKSLSLGDIPALALEDTLARTWGVKVFRESLENGSAACLKNDFGSGVLLNALEPSWRQNFSLGHELFHLMTWDTQSLSDEDGMKRDETLADIFSSSLLMPEEPVRNEFIKLVENGKIRWYDLMMLARRYAVSTVALLWRLTNLNLLDASVPRNFLGSEELRGIDKDLRKDDNSAESVLPQHFVALAYKAYNDGSISIGRLAELLEVSISELDDVLAAHGIDLNSDVYETSVSTS
jgi:XRE family transcriptional regulator, fatty acid utilization regulator